MGQILHGSATTTHAIRAAIQRSTAPLKELAAQYGLNQKMDLPRFCGELLAHFPALDLELHGALERERRMPSDGGIVEPVDISGQSAFGLAARLPRDRPDQFERLEERLDDGVVVAVSLAAHRDQQAPFA